VRIETWWAREDSNLQPVRYEPAPRLRQNCDFGGFTKMTSPLIFDWTSSPRRACMQNR
jgi:hypothetical protein